MASTEGTISPAERDALRRRAAEIGSKLDAAKARHAPPPDRVGGRSDIGQAMRIIVDLGAGLLVGGFIGWSLDRLTGYPPWLMLLFAILGFVAGMMNVLRSMKRMHAKAVAGKPAPAAVDWNDEDDDEKR